MKRFTMWSLLPALLPGMVALLAAPGAQAAPPCGAVEFRFQPGARNLQIVVWVEDAAGKVVATPYLTRAVGQFGIANRPGTPLLKTACGWPYGRREMIFPVWAHRRNVRYRQVVMGGACGNSAASKCPASGQSCGQDCWDDTVAYHSLVSSAETHFCAPGQCNDSNPDVITCASPVRSLSKGAYAAPPAYSLYPPRADLTEQQFNAIVDSPDVMGYAQANDLVAVSQATPLPNQPLPFPLYWNPRALPEGDYAAYIELAQESDWNGGHGATNPNHPCQDDVHPEWNGAGHCFLGQPSVVYRVPFHYGAGGAFAGTSSYAGYGTWDGSDGVLHAPDATISDAPGTGAGRLVDVSGDGQGYRFAVQVGACPPKPDGGAGSPDGGAMPSDGGAPDGGVMMECDAPGAVTDLQVTPEAGALRVEFRAPASGPQPSMYSVRYRLGTDPITDGDFDRQLSGAALAGGAPDAELQATVANLLPGTEYVVAVRGVADCGAASPVVSASTQTAQLQFATLHGCFVATAAWGTPMDGQVDVLRHFRDTRLRGNPLGEVFTAGYYAFGPYLARLVAADEHLRALARHALEPLIELAAYASTR